MNKTMKVILGVMIAVLLSLNLAVIKSLNEVSVKLKEINIIEQRLASISNDMGLMRNNVSNSSGKSKEVTQNDIMTPTELAEYLKVDISEVYKTIIENPSSDFPKVTLDWQTRFSKKAIDEYMLEKSKK
jgi:uncharacterized protein YxeA